VLQRAGSAEVLQGPQVRLALLPVLLESAATVARLATAQGRAAVLGKVVVGKVVVGRVVVGRLLVAPGRAAPALWVRRARTHRIA
jgi:hypothetical protein